MSNCIVRLDNVHYNYEDGKEVLRGINFSVNKGESVGLVGANGEGKSTILMHLTGLLLSKKGNVYIDEELVEKKTLVNIREKVGFVFQNPEEQLFMTTVYEDVAFGPRNYKLSEDMVYKKVEETLRLVGIEYLMNRSSHKLSGGERHLAAIATVLVLEPELLVMDEPTSALDPKARRRIINLLNNVSKTKIIATHDLDMVLETCERIIIIKDGKVACDGLAKNILTDEKLMNKYGLELPLCLQKIRIK